jgi:hypothetical protein
MLLKLVRMENAFMEIVIMMLLINKLLYLILMMVRIYLQKIVKSFDNLWVICTVDILGN